MHGQEKNNTEQLILEAAEQEFFAKGFGGARTAVIAENAGVTHAMLHYSRKKHLAPCADDYGGYGEFRFANRGTAENRYRRAL